MECLMFPHDQAQEIYSWQEFHRNDAILFSVHYTEIHNTEYKICCCCSVAKSCQTLCNPMDCSTPGFPVLHYFPEFAQTHVHWVSDAIQPTHPLSPPFPPALSLFQHQGLFPSCGKSIWASALASVLLMNIQGSIPLEFTGLISFLSRGLSSVFSSTIIQKHQFSGTQPTLWSNSHICTLSWWLRW